MHVFQVVWGTNASEMRLWIQGGSGTYKTCLRGAGHCDRRRSARVAATRGPSEAFRPNLALLSPLARACLTHFADSTIIASPPTFSSILPHPPALVDLRPGDRVVRPQPGHRDRRDRRVSDFGLRGPGLLTWVMSRHVPCPGRREGGLARSPSPRGSPLASR